MDSDWAGIALGFLAFVLLVGAGMVIAFQVQPDTPGEGVLDDTTRQTGLQNYPFGTDRGFNSERN